MMPRFITALFEGRRQAEQAIATLQHKGFNGANIQHVDQSRARDGFFERLFLDENGGDLQPEVSLMGITRARVEQYARLVRSGLSLVIVMCDDHQVESVRDILEGYDVVDVGSMRQGPERSGSADEEGDDRRRQGGPGWFEVVEIDDRDRYRQGARSHAVHVQPKRDVHHEGSDEMAGAHRSRIFEDLRREFQVHYAEHYADGEGSFEDYELAYRFGIQLAQSAPLTQLGWEAIEGIAREGWEAHTDRAWRRFGGAVRFGWQTCKFDRRCEEEHRRGGRWTH